MFQPSTSHLYFDTRTWNCLYQHGILPMWNASILSENVSLKNKMWILPTKLNSYPLRWFHDPRKGHHIPLGKLCFWHTWVSVTPTPTSGPSELLSKQVKNKATRHGFPSGFNAGLSRISYNWKFILQWLYCVSQSQIEMMRTFSAVHFMWTEAQFVIRVSGGLHP